MSRLREQRLIAAGQPELAFLDGDLERLADFVLQPRNADLVITLPNRLQRRQHELLKTGHAHLFLTLPPHPTQNYMRKTPNRVGSDPGVKRGRKRQRQNPPRFPRRDNAVVPEAGGRVVGRPLGLVFGPNWRLERFLVGLRPFAPFRLERVAPQRREHARRLFAAHDADARVGPHEEEARRIGAPAHAVIAGAERAADNQGDLGHVGAGDRGDELRAVLGDASRLVALPDHEAGDILQEQHRHVALGAEFDEMRPLERAVGKQDAIAGDDADEHA